MRIFCSAALVLLAVACEGLVLLGYLYAEHVASTFEKTFGSPDKMIELFRGVYLHADLFFGVVALAVALPVVGCFWRFKDGVASAYYHLGAGLLMLAILFITVYLFIVATSDLYVIKGPLMPLTKGG